MGIKAPKGAKRVKGAVVTKAGYMGRGTARSAWKKLKMKGYGGGAKRKAKKVKKAKAEKPTSKPTKAKRPGNIRLG